MKPFTGKEIEEFDKTWIVDSQGDYSVKSYAIMHLERHVATIRSDGSCSIYYPRFIYDMAPPA